MSAWPLSQTCLVRNRMACCPVSLLSQTPATWGRCLQTRRTVVVLPSNVTGGNLYVAENHTDLESHLDVALGWRKCELLVTPRIIYEIHRLSIHPNPCRNLLQRVLKTIVTIRIIQLWKWRRNSKVCYITCWLAILMCAVSSASRDVLAMTVWVVV